MIEGKNQNSITIKKPKKTKPIRYKSFTKLILINLTYSMGETYFGYALVYLSVIDFSTIIRIYSI
jgi:hypothetical protein